MKDTKKNILRSWKYYKKSKTYFIKFIIIMIIMMVYNIAAPILAAQSIISLTNNNFDKLIMLSFLIFILEVITRILKAYSDICALNIYSHNLIEMTTDFGKTILKLTNKTLDDKGTGFFVRRIQDDITNVADITNTIIYDLSEMLVGLGVLILILFISPVCFVFFIIISLINYFYNKYKMNVYEKKDLIYRDKSEKVTSLVTELVRGIRDIKMLNCENNFIKELSNRINNTIGSFYDREHSFLKYSTLGGCFFNLCDMLSILLLIFLLLTGHLSIVLALIIYNNYSIIDNFYYYIERVLGGIKKFNISSNRLFEIMDNDEYEKEIFGTKKVNKLNGNIKFNDVEFSYKDNKVLDKISFDIKQNKTYAITGPSGVGKTTIFNLICKMYNVNKGEILLDGNNINDLDRESIRDNITIISQNPYIFNLSIKDNFKLVKENITDEEIVEACKIACLDEFINELSDGYDTVLGEGGVNLSGGQRQRLAIARALIQKTEIILFDEATSALDNVTEREITKAINNLKGNYTIIVVAHRLSTIINSDEILYLEKGKVKAKGKHKELLKNCIEYKTLYDKELLK